MNRKQMHLGYRFNAFAFSSFVTVKELGIEFHIAGSWIVYDNPVDKLVDEDKYGVVLHQIDL